MLMSWMAICTFLLFLSSAVYADRYKEPTFKVEKIANIIYASNVPQLSKKHFVTTLASGLRTSPDALFYDREPYKTDVLKRIIEFLYKYMQ